jgi:hypothetical protein
MKCVELVMDAVERLVERAPTASLALRAFRVYFCDVRAGRALVAPQLSTLNPRVRPCLRVTAYRSAISGRHRLDSGAGGSPLLSGWAGRSWRLLVVPITSVTRTTPARPDQVKPTFRTKCQSLRLSTAPPALSGGPGQDGARARGPGGQAGPQPWWCPSRFPSARSL